VVAGGGARRRKALRRCGPRFRALPAWGGRGRPRGHCCGNRRSDCGPTTAIRQTWRTAYGGAPTARATRKTEREREGDNCTGRLLTFTRSSRGGSRRCRRPDDGDRWGASSTMAAAKAAASSTLGLGLEWRRDTTRFPRPARGAGLASLKARATSIRALRGGIVRRRRTPQDSEVGDAPDAWARCVSGCGA
jgi:hypothetical protein